MGGIVSREPNILYSCIKIVFKALFFNKIADVIISNFFADGRQHKIP